MEKFFIRSEPENDTPVLGMYYDGRPGMDIFTIGGMARDRLWLERIGQDFFGLDFNDRKVVAEKWSAKNKVQFLAIMPRVDFVNGCEAMKNAGIVVIPTRHMERVMR
jgi:hypothetical protein